MTPIKKFAPKASFPAFRLPLPTQTGAALVLAALLGGCVGEPSIQSGDDAEVVMGSLARVDNTAVDLAYVDPNVDYRNYRKVYVQPLNLDKVEIIQPETSSSMVNRFNRDWELTDEDKHSLQDAFKTVMEKELSAGGAYEIASGPGDDVLEVEAMLTQIRPSGPKDDQISRSTARSRVFTSGAGSMSIAIMIADSDSGEVLALIKDERNRRNTDMWMPNNRVSNMAEVRQNFATWAKQIHRGLVALNERDPS